MGDYRGPHPFSESETKTMKMLQKKLNFAKVMGVHSYAKDVRINYGCVALPPQIHKLFMMHANTMARLPSWSKQGATLSSQARSPGRRCWSRCGQESNNSWQFQLRSQATYMWMIQRLLLPVQC